MVRHRRLDASYSYYPLDNSIHIYDNQELLYIIIDNVEATQNALANLNAAVSKCREELRAGLHNESQEMRAYRDKLIRAVSRWRAAR
jgi:hypothetical protein